MCGGIILALIVDVKTKIKYSLSMTLSQIKKHMNQVLAISLTCVLGGFGTAWSEGMVTLNFDNVGIPDIAKSMSQILNKNFLLDDSVSGKVSIIATQPVTIAEANTLFEDILSRKGYTIVKTGVVYQIMKKADAIRTPHAVLSENETLDGNMMATQIIPIEHIRANEIQKALRGMFSRSKGRMVAYGPTNSLIVTDMTSNIQRLREIVLKLDKPGFAATVEYVCLNHSQAKDVAAKLQQIFKNSSKGSSKKSSSFSTSVAQGPDVSSIMPDERTNCLILTANGKGLEKAMDLIAKLDTETSGEANRSVMHVHRLKHAKAEDVATLLSGILSGAGAKKKGKSSFAKGSSKGSDSKSGDKKADKKPIVPARTIDTGSGAVSSGLFENEINIGAEVNTNSLVITASYPDYMSLKPVIDELDRRRPQVFVEALIMEVKVGAASVFGVSMHGGADVKGGGGVGISSSPSGSTLNETVAQKAGNGAFNKLLTGGGLGLGLMSGSVSLGSLEIPGIGGLLEAVKDNNDYNVLSSPTILTSDNQEALISVGQTVTNKETTRDSSGFVTETPKRENADLELKVTPQINDGDEVTLKVEQTIKEPIKGGDFVELSSRKAKTTIIAQNGQTVVIGGLIKDRITNNEKKIPILGDVPIVGSLFKRKQKDVDKVNLMLFLTPTILRDAKDMSRISVAQNKRRQKFNEKNGLDEQGALYDYGFNETLNLAPAVSREEANKPKAKPAATPVKPKKYFDFLNEEDASASDTSPTPADQSQVVRDRYTRPIESGAVANQPRKDNNEGGTDTASTDTGDSANPFANVRPN